jgi:predicted amidohydrolase
MSRLGIACVQLEALGLERAEEALERALQGVEEAGRHRPDLILLPECTYPAYYLHSLEAYHRAEPRPLEEVLHLFGEKARRHRAYVAVGLVRPHPSGRLRNSMALLDPQGQVLGFHDKIFLWHFDREWFDPGSDLPVFDLPFGRVGLMICADARMPEIPRALAMQGARLILDATALVTSTGAPEARTNPQVTYLLPARALENGLWIAWANKVGAEAESILYCGRSGVVGPDGAYRALGSPDREEIVLAEVDLAAAPGPRARPSASAPWWNTPGEALPVARRLREPIPADSMYLRVGVLQLKPYEDPEAWRRQVEELGERLTRQGASLLILPGIPEGWERAPAYQQATALDALQALSARLACALIAPLADEGRVGIHLIDRGQEIARHRVGEPPRALETPWGSLGVLGSHEIWAPEIARSLMAQGVELLIWFPSARRATDDLLARTRADENRVFLVRASPLFGEPGPSAAVFDPLGQPLATGMPDREQGILASLFRPLTRHKEMAPGSHIVFDRPSVPSPHPAGSGAGW